MASEALLGNSRKTMCRDTSSLVQSQAVAIALSFCSMPALYAFYKLAST